MTDLQPTCHIIARTPNLHASDLLQTVFNEKFARYKLKAKIAKSPGTLRGILGESEAKLEINF